MEKKVDAVGNKLPRKVGDKYAGNRVVFILPNGTFVVEKPGKYQGEEYYIYSSSGMSKFGNALDMTTDIDSAKTKAEKIDRQSTIKENMKKLTKSQEKKPLLESYNRLFGKMDSFDRLGIKKGKLQESNYFDDSVQFGVKVSLRQIQGMTYVYRDVLRSLGIQEDATDQYIAPDEDSFFDMMYAVIENGVDPKEFVEVVINGKSMSGTKFIQQYGDEFGWDGGESEIDQ